MLRLSLALSLAFLSINVSVLAQAARSPEPAVASEAQLMQALLGEIRQLRAVLERSMLIGGRIQIGIQRLQLQEARVARMSRQLDDARTGIADMQAEQVRFTEQAKQLENEVLHISDANARRVTEQEIKAMKAQVEQAKVQEQQRRARESELSSALLAEQAKLNELQDWLMRMERALEPAK